MDKKNENKKCDLIINYLNTTSIEKITPHDKALVINNSIFYQEETCRNILKNKFKPYQEHPLCYKLYKKLDIASSASNGVMSLLKIFYHGINTEIIEVINLISQIIKQDNKIIIEPLLIKLLYLYTKVIFSILKINDSQQDTVLNNFPKISIPIKEKALLAPKFPTIQQELINAYYQLQQQLLKTNVTP